MSWKSNLAIVVLALGAGAGGLVAGQHWFAMNPPPGSLSLGQPTLEFELPDLDGGIISPARFRGRVVLINFWAPWCEPCIREIPMFKTLRAEYGKERFEILGVALDSPDDVRRYVATAAIDYPIALADMADFALMRAYGNDRDALPFSVLIDADGRLRARKLGEYHEAELRRDIEAAMVPGLGARD